MRPRSTGWPPGNSAHGKRSRPKVIASTATARRAPRQIGALFDRQTEVFPPPGLDIGDSFFARQRPTSPDAEHYAPGRRYVGICAHGIRMKSTLIRVYVSVLGAAQKLHEKYGKNPVTDPYMTLVGYFNSLRDLGGMRRLVEDDVSARLTRAEERGLARRYDPLLQELTSRLSSTEIPERARPPDGAVRHGPAEGRAAADRRAAGHQHDRGRGGRAPARHHGGRQPAEVQRRVRAGDQPDRAARARPGVHRVQLGPAARPVALRDLRALPRHDLPAVEALSVTPFADRAVDRGLTGVLVALVRDLGDTYNGNLRAAAFDRNDELADHIVRYLKRRAGNVSGDNAVSDGVEHQLDARLDQWNKERQVPGRRLAYDRPGGAADDVVGAAVAAGGRAVAADDLPDLAAQRRPGHPAAAGPRGRRHRDRPDEPPFEAGSVRRMTAAGADACRCVMTSPLRVGELRPNQLLHTYGVGAVADLPNLSVVVAGLDDWDLANSAIVTERRLLAAVQAQLGPQVETLRTPPYKPETADPFADWARIGVPVRLFPRWLRCSDTRCNRLAPVESGLFDAAHRPVAAGADPLRARLPRPRLQPADGGARPVRARLRARPPG